MTWVKLDDRFFDNPKIAAISDAGQLAVLKAFTYCARALTDGYIPLKKAKEYASPKVVKELVPGLWEPCEGGFRVHDYLAYNPTRAEVLKQRQEVGEARSKAGSKGAAKRWQTNSKTDGKSIAPFPTPDPVSRSPIPDPIPTPDPPEGGGGSILKLKYEDRIGPLNSKDATEFARWERTVPDTWIIEAIEETEERSEAFPFPYLVATLKNAVEMQRSPRGHKKKQRSTNIRNGFMERLEQVKTNSA